MRRSCKVASRQVRRGVAAVEFAVLLPFLCFVFVATIDYCRIFYSAMIVSNCARNGALYGSADRTRAQDTGGIKTAALADASDLASGQTQVSSSTDVGLTYVDVQVTYPFRTITKYPGIPRETILSRTCRMSVVPPAPKFW